MLDLLAGLFRRPAQERRDEVGDFGRGRVAAVGDLDRDPSPASEDIIQVQGAFVAGSLVGLGLQIFWRADQWLPELWPFGDQVEQLGGQSPVPSKQMLDLGDVQTRAVCSELA